MKKDNKIDGGLSISHQDKVLYSYRKHDKKKGKLLYSEDKKFVIAKYPKTNGLGEISRYTSGGVIDSFLRDYDAQLSWNEFQSKLCKSATISPAERASAYKDYKQYNYTKVYKRVRGVCKKKWTANEGC